MWHEIIISCQSNDLVHLNNDTQAWGNWEYIIFYGLWHQQRRRNKSELALAMGLTSSFKNAEESVNKNPGWY